MEIFVFFSVVVTHECKPTHHSRRKHLHLVFDTCTCFFTPASRVLKGKRDTTSGFVTHLTCNNRSGRYTANFLENMLSNCGEDSCEVCSFVMCACPGEAPRCDMGEVRRILQQEEHHHVWWHRTQLSHEPTEWSKGTLSAWSSSSRSSLFHQHYTHQFPKLIWLCVCVRFDPLWRPILTGRRIGSCINYLSTSKRSPSLKTSVDSTTNTGRGRQTYDIYTLCVPRL